MQNLNPKKLNPSARDIGIGTVKTNLTIKPENKAMAKQIGGGNISAGVDRAIEASNAIATFKESLGDVETEQLMSLSFAVSSLALMPHQILGSDRMDQKAIDADVLRWIIQRELDSRKAGDLPYSWLEMYLAMGIPKEFFNV